MNYKTFVVNYNSKIDGVSVEIARNDVKDVVVLNGIVFVPKQQVEELESRLTEVKEENKVLKSDIEDIAKELEIYYEVPEGYTLDDILIAIRECDSQLTQAQDKIKELEEQNALITHNWGEDSKVMSEMFDTIENMKCCGNCANYKWCINPIGWVCVWHDGDVTTGLSTT